MAGDRFLPPPPRERHGNSSPELRPVRQPGDGIGDDPTWTRPRSRRPAREAFRVWAAPPPVRIGKEEGEFRQGWAEVRGDETDTGFGRDGKVRWFGMQWLDAYVSIGFRFK
ncbi:hypothetical protein NL676_031515 [Syzygium grande]|nr:hypothetical protein NL676_031515 [Syzygium grande]